MNSFAKLLLISPLLTLAFSAQASAQISTGVPPFSSIGGGPFDAVNLGNLNVHFAIPVLQKAGRGTAFTYDLSYDSSIWTPSTGGTAQWAPVSNWGWRGITEAGTGYISYSQSSTVNGACTTLAYTNYIYHDSFGAPHPFPGSATHIVGVHCSGGLPLTATASDGSGYILTGAQGPAPAGQLTDRRGKVIAAPLNATNGAATLTDANGNQLTVNSSGQFFDTLSSTTPVLTVAGSGTPSSPTTYTYTPPSGSATYKMNYTQYTVQTAFGFSSTIKEYGPASVPLVSSITLPDNSSYSFTYESGPGNCVLQSGTSSCVTGRITKITLPTGGTITYTYTGGPNSTGIFSDGSTSGLSRVLNPGGTWGYSRALISGTPAPGSTWTTTVTDPLNDQTLINFAEDGTLTSTKSNTAATYNFYETQRQVNQLINGNQALLLTTQNCYNINYGSCATATVFSPIETIASYYQPANGNTRASVVSYNGSFPGSGLVNDDKEYGYGVTLGTAPTTGYLVRETAISYAALGNNILDHPAKVSVYDWTTGKMVTLASTTYTYDQGTPSGTIGTPQQVSITGSRGNLTTLATLTSGTATLSKTITYYDTGNPNVATDVNGAQTTYVYGTGSCGNSFPTTIGEPLGLSRSMTWNCTGGVMLTATDENSNVVTADYTDPDFWRPDFTKDQLNNETTYIYPSQNIAESSLLFNSSQSAIDIRVTLDGFGRPILNQRGQTPSPTEYDSFETDYNIMAQASRSTMPFQATKGTTNSTAPATTLAYDALGRPTLVTDGGSGTVSYQYIQNDILQTVGPTQNFSKQLEYDGLGRLASVCEITAVSGSGSCGQSNSATGFLTKYTYDALGNLLTVTQNAQPGAIGGQQTRTYTYDGLSRLTSETNPETANLATSYTYDSDTADSCSSGTRTSAGDMLRRTDANGHNSCFIYDALHRLTDVGNSIENGSSPCKRFRYDTVSNALQTQPQGSTVANVASRLVEAETDNCTAFPPTSASVITDEWFSYDADANPTDLYESTPQSAGYYHSAAVYWANGGINTLGLYNASTRASLIPLQTYAVEGEGRTKSVSAASGQNPVTSVAYTLSGTTEPIGSLTNVTFGSADSDNFQYDPKTGRMTQYSPDVNGQSLVGKLNWNPNGTLGQLAITDPFNSQDNGQTCTNTYDDLARVSGNSCTNNAWAQTFSYDPFGNLTKSGSISWACAGCYNTPMNRYNTVLSSNILYDNNGDLLNDPFNTYTWDVYGNLASANGNAATYDAFNRMVQNPSGEFVYPPAGQQPLAQMSGQATVTGYIPLPGGAVAIYNSSGLVQYNHPDWLGSARLISTPGRIAYTLAFAPFGEAYAYTGSPWTQFTEAGNIWTVNDGGNQGGTLDDFTYRRYSPVQGRWISPDPAGLAAVDPTNPQTWNRYAYVANNPLSYVDPLGLQVDGPHQCSISGDSCTGGGNPGGGGWVYVAQGLIDFNSESGTWGSWGVWVYFGGQGQTDGGTANNRFTLGVLAPGQTWRQCMAANANNYSMGGATELAANVVTGTSTSYSSSLAISTFTGNAVSGLIFGEDIDAAQAGLTNAPDLINAGIGTVTTYGRNSTEIMALNIARSGGAPQALSSASSSVGSFLESASSLFTLGMGTAYRWSVDFALTGAEAIGCSIPRGD